MAVYIIQHTLLPSGTFKETMGDNDLDIMFVPGKGYIFMFICSSCISSSSTLPSSTLLYPPVPSSSLLYSTLLYPPVPSCTLLYPPLLVYLQAHFLLKVIFCGIYVLFYDK